MAHDALNVLAGPRNCIVIRIGSERIRGSERRAKVATRLCDRREQGAAASPPCARLRSSPWLSSVLDSIVKDPLQWMGGDLEHRASTGEATMSDGNPFRCFQGRFLRDVILIALAILALTLLGRRFNPGTAPRLAIAVVQALLMVWFVVMTVLTIRRLDELMLKLHLEAIAISFTVTGAVIAGWG